jgi:ABC-type sugar transport system ATPase subunit
MGLAMQVLTGREAPEAAIPFAATACRWPRVPVFSVRDLSKRFGPVEALKRVSLDVYPGEIHAICGENGAGKSTLVKMLAGIDQPDSGTIRFDGKPCALASPAEAQRLGVAMVAQELSVCPDLTVLDNIWLGSMEVPILHRRRALRERAREALALLGVDQISLDMPVRALTMGERQLVEIARMLTRNAQIFILDEPTATLSDGEIDRIFEALARIRGENRSVIYITHRLAEVFRICDSVTVLRNGEMVGCSPTAATDRKHLIELMLGRSFVEMYPAHGHAIGETILQIDHLCIPGAVSDFSVSVPRGDIVCIAGQVGSGAESVIRAVAGLVYDATGSVRIAGKAMRLGSAEEAVRHNVMFVSGDRAEEGIFRSRSVSDNLVATRLADVSRFGFLNPSVLRAKALDLAARVGVDRRRLRSRAGDLSGGNQQKLAFGRCFGKAEAGVIVLIEPTRGIDIGARAEIYQLMRDFCAQGYGLLVASTDLEEVVGLGDAVVTMYRSRQVSCYRGSEISMQNILADITHPLR